MSLSPSFLSPFFFLLLLILLQSTTVALDLASHCSSLTSPGECPCSVRNLASPSFCLSPSSSSTCVQRPCPARYVCDCAGTTLCRAVASRSVLSCTAPLSAAGACKCARMPLRTAPGAHPATTLLPLRKFSPLNDVPDVLPKGVRFCSERPDFWAGRQGAMLLDAHWESVAVRDVRGMEKGQGGRKRLFRFGHQGHAVTFTSAHSLSMALSHVSSEAGFVSGEPLDSSSPGVNRLVSECSAALINARLGTLGLGTRARAAPPAFDVAGRLVLQACPHVSRGNAAVGMSVGQVLERAMRATGEFPLDEGGLSHEEAVQACMAINRNFEGCAVDLGCVKVAS